MKQIQEMKQETRVQGGKTLARKLLLMLVVANALGSVQAVPGAGKVVGAGVGRAVASAVAKGAARKAGAVAVGKAAGKVAAGQMSSALAGALAQTAKKAASAKVVCASALPVAAGVVSYELSNGKRETLQAQADVTRRVGESVATNLTAHPEFLPAALAASTGTQDDSPLSRGRWLTLGLQVLGMALVGWGGIALISRIPFGRKEPRR